MKKILAIVMAMTMGLSLVACGSSSSTSESAAETETEASAEEAVETEEAEAASTEDAQYVVGILQLVQHDALDAATQGFKDALTEALGDSVTFIEQNAQGDSNTCSTVITDFVSRNVDLILANATAPLQAAAAGTNEIPILGTSITDYATALEISDWTGTVGGNISGTSDLAPLDQQADMLEELFPVADYPNVGLLYCSAEANSQYQVDVITEYLEAKGYTCTPYGFSDTNDLSSVATTANDNSDVIYIPTDNTAASNTELINNICFGQTPIIAGEEGICSGCGVATLSISYYDIGYVSGQMAVQILAEGADISTMPVQYAPTVTKEYNLTNCEALGVTIPDDYTAIAAE
jgi:putative ABC transport system substrate-binding protein